MYLNHQLNLPGVWLLACCLWVSWLGGAAAWSAVPSPTPEELDASDRVVELAPGILIDSSEGVAYLMGSEGGVDALALTDGSLLWRSEQADKPLAAYGNLLLSQSDLPTAQESEASPLMLLDRKTGEQRSRLQMDLPATLRIDRGPGGAPELVAQTQDGELLVAWSRQANYLQARPDRARPRPTRASPLEQAFRIDLSSESAVAVPTKRLGEAPQSTQELVNRAPLPSLEGGPVIVERLSADERHVLLSQRVAPGQPEEYLWTLVTRATGQVVGKIRADSSFAHFYLQDHRLIYIQRPVGDLVDGRLVFSQKRLRCVDLRGDSLKVSEEWSHPVRDLTYRGPLPH